MSLGPLLTDVVVTFCLAAGLLYHYGNCMRHHIVVTIAVLIAWYFSFLIVFVLPLDVSSTVYRQCIGKNETTENGTEIDCKKPWSDVPDNVFPNLWRVVYWTSQCLTWLIMPVMQSYSRAGEFTWKGKIKSAIIDNTIYYGTYLFICGILLIYLALQPSVELDGQKLKAIASSASNTWGLFLLVLLLGYALVEVPRSLWNASKKGYSLHYAYFHAAKLSCDKCEAQDAVDDVLETLKALSAAVRPNHPQYRNVETILQKVPVEMRERMNRRPAADDSTLEPPTEKSLVRFHKQVIKALQTQHRTETQWDMLVRKIFLLEDVAKNQVSHDHRFKWSFPPQRSSLVQAVFSPTVEWYWRCVLHSYVLKFAAVVCGILSTFVVWSEVTFFNKEPVLSLFANFLNLAKINYDYFTIEVLSTLIIAYLCFCAYSTVLKIRVLNHYYIAPHHQTDEFSLIFSGMMLCRLTPPMCLNFLGLIHMDSHIIKKRILETHYTRVMGHMDVIAIISDGFNIYFPMLMLAFCLATYFSLGSRVLSMLGFQQFVGDDELTGELVDEGRELIKRERRRLERNEESLNRRREFQERFGSGTASRYRPTTRTTDPEHDGHQISTESVRAGLLESSEYYVGTEEDEHIPFSQSQGGNLKHLAYPPRGLFDDV